MNDQLRWKRLPLTVFVYGFTIVDDSKSREIYNIQCLDSYLLLP